MLARQAYVLCLHRTVATDANCPLQAIQVLLADPDVSGLEVCDKDLCAQKDGGTYQMSQYHLCTELCKTQDSKNCTQEENKHPYCASASEGQRPPLKV